MANIFTKTIEEFEKPNKNTFNRSFTNNLTLRFGEFTPCFVKEVMPSQSVRIKPTFGFNMHPLVFPVQTKMRCNLHFFYVRNRPLWKGWMDFYGKTENLDGDDTPPYIDFSGLHSFLKAGSLYDNLGIPCTVTYKDDFIDDILMSASNLQDRDYYGYFTSITDFTPYTDANSWNRLLGTTEKELSPGIDGMVQRIAVLENKRPLISIDLSYQDLQNLVNSTFSSNSNIGTTSNNKQCYLALLQRTASGAKVVTQLLLTVDINHKLTYSLLQGKIVTSGSLELENLHIKLEVPLLNQTFFLAVLGNSQYSDSSNDIVFDDELNSSESLTNAYISAAGTYNLSDISAEYNPYYMSHDNEDGIKVSALPLRAYEAIYNSFYRDERNNPLIIDGKEIYNQFTRSTDGGPSSSEPRVMYKANWMPDAYTTAVQTPQQGDLIPLVGVTATGLMTFEDENGKSYTLQANLADDGTLTGIQSHSSDMPTGTLRAMVDSISTGISINDFRNVNALQRWLEKNVRRGLRYKDIVETHFGNKIKYSEVDVPEFIGGVSRMVDINKVVQTSSDVPDSPLGTLAGIGNIFGDTDAVIQHYCDEPGWIIGIISVVPEPVYSQRLDKQLTKFSLLDYYFPEFAHIGYQPIFNQELTPLQLSNSDGKRALDVFGYQRPWHEYISAFDEVHGDFQTNMRDYLIQRVFGDVPQLSEEFLLVDRDIANAVFADTEDNSKIFGQIYFDFVTQIPIPKYGIPRLEA